VGGDRAAALWLDEYGPGLVHVHSLIDLASDRPRRSFSTEPLKAAWEGGIPGFLDWPDLERSGGPILLEAPRSTAAVALGSDGARAWFLLVDSMTPRPPLGEEAAGELMFHAGECAAILLHRDLDDPAPVGQGEEVSQGNDRRQGFAGWPVLRDIEAFDGSEEASRRIATRFLVARLLRGLLDEGLASQEESLGYQIGGVRRELDVVPGGDGERLAWERVLRAVERNDQADLVGAALEMGEKVEGLGHFHGAKELHQTAYELSMSLGIISTAVDAARYHGRVCRKLALWDEAVEWYGQARDLATLSRDHRRGSLAMSGLAMVYSDRGNLKQARETLHEILRAGQATGDRETLSAAHHGLMAVEKLADSVDVAIVHGWKAVQAYETEEGRLQALFELAGVFREAGELGAAEDAYTVVAKTVRTFEYRLLAHDALAFIAAIQQRPEEYEKRRQRVDALGWETASAQVQAQVLHFRGLACQALGRKKEARRWLTKALAYAEDKHLGRLVFDNEEALGRLTERKGGEYTTPRPPTEGRLEEVAEIRVGIREMREAVTGGVP
jgi:tetratricopeptide (TPR) repeat protein